jgi:prepilin-type processing-associated H-X9-DG protein
MQRCGFSRIEVLLVVAVTGVVAAMLLPVLAQNADDAMRERESSLREQCILNLSQIGKSIRMYTQDYDEKYPPVAIGGESYGWALALRPYLKSRDLFQCPSERHPRNDNPREPGYTDYWYNRNLANNKTASVKEPVLTLMFGDGDGGYIASNARYAIDRLPKSWIITYGSPTYGSPARRHLNSANYAFADGHVRWYHPKLIDGVIRENQLTRDEYGGYIPPPLDSAEFNGPTFRIK